MANKGSDPADLWRSMLGEMERGFNAFANQAMAAPDFRKVVDQVGGATAGAQKQLGDLMERYLTNMNLPSRAQMENFGERLQAIETQLAEMTALLRNSEPASPQATETQLAEIIDLLRKSDPIPAPATEAQLAEIIALLRRSETVSPEVEEAKPAPRPRRSKRPPVVGGEKK